MLIELELGDERMTVEIPDGPQGEVRVQGQPVACEWVELPGGHYSVLLDGRVFDLRVKLHHDRAEVFSSDGTMEFKIRDPRRLMGDAVLEEGREGLQRVLADMPGKVIRLMVKSGDTVEFEQALLVVEAMKMQNEIRAPKSGTVRDITVAEGEAVSAGDVLLTLE